ncbi:hypothetical protein KKHFBJBL_03150 [Brevundimonas sp. NIBR11]|nr:hypothetical protein KKHFBJBL_03150 [Brevundimonas sp. NIBR11]
MAWSVSAERQSGALETYRASLGDLYEIRDVDQTPGVAFWNRTTVFRFGSSILGRGRSASQTFTRDAERIRRSGLDHVSVVVNLSDGVGDFDGRSAVMGGGSVQFRDLARPSRSSTTEVDILNLICPRDIVPSWFLNRSFHGLVLAGDSAGGRLIASHLKTLALVGNEISEDQGIAAVDATFVIAERFMGGETRPTPLQNDAIQRTIRRRAIQMFDIAMVRGETPDVSQVATAVGVSRSSLYRAFHDMGGVRTYLRNRRLDRLYAALRSGEADPRALAEVVGRTGFSSIAQLEREFRDRFGFPPGEVAPSRRRPVQTALNEAGAARLDFAAHDVFIDWLRTGGPT